MTTTDPNPAAVNTSPPPRFIGLDPAGAALYAANQDSDTIVAFRVDRQSGTLTPTGQVVAVGSPSTIVFR